MGVERRGGGRRWECSCAEPQLWVIHTPAPPPPQSIVQILLPTAAVDGEGRLLLVRYFTSVSRPNLTPLCLVPASASYLKPCLCDSRRCVPPLPHARFQSTVLFSITASVSCPCLPPLSHALVSSFLFKVPRRSDSLPRLFNPPLQVFLDSFRLADRGEREAWWAGLASCEIKPKIYTSGFLEERARDERGRGGVKERDGRMEEGG